MKIRIIAILVGTYAGVTLALPHFLVFCAWTLGLDIADHNKGFMLSMAATAVAPIMATFAMIHAAENN